MQSQLRLSLPAAIAPAAETKAGENTPFVAVEIDEPVVAVHVYGLIAKDDKNDKSDNAEKQSCSTHQSAVNAASGAACFHPDPAMRTGAGRVRNLVFALRTIDKRHRTLRS